MIWIAPLEMDTAIDKLEKRLWDAADQFRANCGLDPQGYSGPILGLNFLRFAEVNKLSIAEHDDPRTAYVNTDKAMFQTRYNQIAAIETAIKARIPP